MVVPVIPCLNPDQKLIKLVQELESYFKDIIVVNDGSISNEIFNKLSEKKNVKVLTHDVNKGKGEALKTAFRYYKETLMNDYSGVITLDCDGQHAVSDVIKMSEIIDKNHNFLLGTRLFNTKQTPLRNKLGNKITSWLFKKRYKVYIKDTQTGLRAIPNRLIDFSINVDGSGFEYEMNVLILLVKKNEIVEEFDIKTIYLKNSNKNSHFKIFKDSYKIYKLFFTNRK